MDRADETQDHGAVYAADDKRDPRPQRHAAVRRAGTQEKGNETAATHQHGKWRYAVLTVVHLPEPCPSISAG